LIAYRHGLRASELCELTWNMIELDGGRIHVRRAKNGVDSTHPLTGKEVRALRQLRRENLQSRFVFNTERGGPVTRAWFLKMVRRTGELAKLPFPIHPHMLRHACGFKLANDGVDTRAPVLLGSPQHHAHGALYRAALRPLRWVLEGLRQRISDETDATGAPRWLRMSKTGIRFLWPRDAVRVIPHFRCFPEVTFCWLLPRLRLSASSNAA